MFAIPNQLEKNGGVPVARVRHLTVSLENRPGEFAAVAKVLADAKVNILAVLGSTAGAQGSAQVVVDNFAAAKKALFAAHFSFAVGTLEQVELPNKLGALAEFTARLAKRGINIDAAYGTALKGAKKSVLFFATSKQGGAEKGVPPATP
jgi:hypothetical protein